MKQLLLALALSLIFAAPAFAACSSPTGNEGNIVYDKTNHVLTYCNGTNWVTAGGGLSGGSAGYGAVWSSSSALTYDSSLYVDTTNHRVGIGTTAPAMPLQILTADPKTTTANDKALELGSNDPSSSALQMFFQINSNSTPANNYTTIQSIEEGVAYRNLALNPSGGNVGIGTTAPAATLEVYGGHLLASRGGTAPTVSSCGSSPSISGTDSSFEVTTGSNASCTITFGTAWTTAPNGCTLTAANSAAGGASHLPYVSTLNTTTLVLAASPKLLLSPSRLG